MKYSKLLQPNLSSRLWSHIIFSNYESSLSWVIDICSKFSELYSKDTGNKILQSDIFSNRNRLTPLLSSNHSSFYRITLQQMMDLLQMDCIAVNEEYLFDSVITWCQQYHKKKMSDPKIKKSNNFINPALISKSTDVEEMMDNDTYSFEKWEDLLEIMIQFMRFPIMKTEYLLRKVMPYRELFPKDQFLNLLAFKLSRDLPEADQKDLDFSRFLPFRKVKRKNAPELAYDGMNYRVTPLKNAITYCVCSFVVNILFFFLFCFLAL